MPVTFAVRGDQFKPRYSMLSTYGLYASSQGELPVIGSGTPSGLIGSGYLDLYRSQLNRRSVIYPGSANMSGNPAFSVLIRCAFGDNSGLQGVFTLGGPYGVQTAPSMIYLFFSGSSLNFGLNDEFGTNLIANASFGSFSPTPGRFYDIVITVSGDTTPNGVRCYVDGVLLGSITLGQALQNPRSRGLVTSITIGGVTYDVGSSSQYLNEFVIWDSVIDPTNIALTSGNGSLNGSSRTAFTDVASFQGDLSTDPGASNVAKDVSYLINGSSVTGTRNVVTNVLAEADLTGQSLNAVLEEA